MFDRQQGRDLRDLNRALRDDPALQGGGAQAVDRAVGRVTDIRIEVERAEGGRPRNQLLARIRSFDFGAKDVNPMTVTYPLDFLPS